MTGIALNRVSRIANEKQLPACFYCQNIDIHVFDLAFLNKPEDDNVRLAAHLTCAFVYTCIAVLISALSSDVLFGNTIIACSYSPAVTLDTAVHCVHCAVFLKYTNPCVVIQSTLQWHSSTFTDHHPLLMDIRTRSLTRRRLRVEK